jgi:hypothetical protein
MAKSRPLFGTADHDNHALYERQADKLRELAETQPAGILRDKLLAIAYEFQLLADSMIIDSMIIPRG